MTKVHEIDGVKYREVERDARTGDKVLVVDEPDTKDVYVNVTNADDASLIDTDGKYNSGSVLNLFRSEYRVLEPIEDDEAEPTPPKTTTADLLANLARRVTELERYTYEAPTETGDPNEYDVVNKPQHYNSGKYEVIDIIEDITNTAAKGGASGSECYALGNAVKYLARYRYKNGLECAKKARWYVDRIIEELEKDETKR